MALRMIPVRIVFLASLLALGSLLSGCDAGPEEDGELVVSIPHELAWEAHGITAVHLFLHAARFDSGAGELLPGEILSARSLHLNGSTWTATLGVPVGSYYVRAEALRGGEVAAAATFQLVEIEAGQVPLIQLTLFLAALGEPTENHVPHFLSIGVSTTRARPGATVRITATADDPDGDELFLSAALCPPPCGSIDGAEVRIEALQPHTFVWTAPQAPGLYVVSLQLRDDRGGASEVRVPIFVGELGMLQGNLQIASAPTVTHLGATGAAGSRPDQEQVALRATVAGGQPPLSFRWWAAGARCSGSFTSPSDPAPSFHLSGDFDASCTFGVEIVDARGGTATASVAYRSSARPWYAPALGKDHQSAGTLQPGSPLELRVVADVANPNPHFLWTVPGPGIGPPTISSTDTQSTLTWQVRPNSVRCDPGGATATIEVVVIDTVWNLSSPPVRFTLGVDPKLCL